MAISVTTMMPSKVRVEMLLDFKRAREACDAMNPTPPIE
jgi:hypothetical protein